MSERIQRPHPERTTPNRNPAEILRGLGGRPADAGPADPVSRSMGMGYQIIEQYLEQGRTFAEGMTPRGGGGGATGNIMVDLTQRMIRTTADLFEVWFQLMDVSGAARARATGETPTQASPSSSQNGVTPAAAGTTPAAVSTGVRVQVMSSRPAAVAVDIRPLPADARLIAHSLRSEVEGLPRVTGISVEPSLNGGPVSIKVAIPEGLPAGIYNGMIIDESTSLPVGTISLRLEE